MIVFNGEIYNHLELRCALEASGAAPGWHGHSDTETLLAGISHWGLDETLQRAKGMFALALWDRKKHRLALARDRMGEKPLYWGWAERTLYFASELKALRQHPKFQGDICKEALALYLQFAYVPAPYSIYSGIWKIEPGTIVEVDGPVPEERLFAPLRPGARLGAISIRRYWSLDEAVAEAARAPIHDPREAVAELDRTLAAAVRRQMISDVPLGAFLSGGIDSSTITALMQSASMQPVRTFTIGFPDHSHDESSYADAVARHLGTRHETMVVTDRDAMEIIPNLPQYYDEPFADSSQIPTQLVCSAARRRVTVALSGDGGDELFAGYVRHFMVPRIWKRIGWLPFPLRSVLGGLLSNCSPATWRAVGAVAGSLGLQPPSHLGDKIHKLGEGLALAATPFELYRSLASIWRNDLAVLMVKGLQMSPLSSMDDDLPQSTKDDLILGMSMQDMRTYLPDDILCKVDRAAMAVSLETRAPFLDPDVVSLSLRVPSSLKLRDGKGKWLLRQVLYNHVPEALVDRPKMGFSIPLGKWLRGPLQNWASELISRESLEAGGLLAPEPIAAAWNAHLSGKVDLSSRLWTVLMFQAWLQETHD